MTRLLEHHCLDLLNGAGVQVAPYRAVDTPDAAADAARAIGGPIIVKVLVPTGGRGRAGGVIPVDSPEAAADAARTLLGREHRNFPVHQVLVQSRITVKEEYFCAVTYDSTTRGPL